MVNVGLRLMIVEGLAKVLTEPLEPICDLRMQFSCSFLQNICQLVWLLLAEQFKLLCASHKEPYGIYMCIFKKGPG